MHSPAPALDELPRASELAGTAAARTGLAVFLAFALTVRAGFEFDLWFDLLNTPFETHGCLQKVERSRQCALR